ncbi:FAD-binding domain-containing protein [Marasmius fiardii PR-910]|nr:FAD-binding domain-containing protein [Marasmius fiardii PR-910]
MLGTTHCTLLATFILSLTSGSFGSDCKCLYGDSCWPSDSEFKKLASEVSQPVIRPTPPQAACYPASSPSGNCTDVQTNMFDGNWVSDRAGAYQNINFQEYIFPNGTISACYANVSLGFPCEQGNVPPIGVEARSVADIQAAVRFVAKHNLRLVVKNTGHDYLGRSAGRNAFMIWTHHLKNITYNATFIPERAPASETYKALTIGAGVQWREAYAAAEQNNRYVVGGISDDNSVGAAGGWIGGGGHSAFSAKFGLGADNAIQFTVVTANGKHVTANAHTNDDLFWALRGGGAGTYGVVTSVTFKTHDILPLTLAFVITNFTSPDVAKSVGTEFLKIQPQLADAHWGGYSAISEDSFIYGMIGPNISLAEANTTGAGPFLEFVKKTAGENNTQAGMIPAPSFYALLNMTSSMPAASGSQVGGNVEIVSRLYSRNLYEDQPEKMAETILSIPGGVAINHVAGGFASQVDPDSAGLNPGWRNALAEIYATVSWKDGASAAQIEAQRNELRGYIATMEALEPGAPSYVNEGSLYEPNFKYTYFGDHYDKLLSIKDKYDPQELFVVASGVGSDRWDAELVCRA